MGAPPISDNAASIRSWLMQSPRPAKLHVFSRDGREFDVDVRQNAAWSETATSICALDPDRIEANTPDGKLIRAVNVAELLKKEAKADAQQVATSAAMQHDDPETRRMIVFAELLERAYGKAYDSSQATVQIAFTQLQEICGSLATQASESTRAANELSVGIRNLIIQQAQEAVDNATPEPSPLEQMAANFMSGQRAGEATAASGSGGSGKTTNGKTTNGKH